VSNLSRGRRPERGDAAREPPRTAAPLAAGSNARRCGLPDPCRQSFGAHHVKGEARDDPLLSGDDPGDVIAGKDEKASTAFARAHDEIVGAAKVPADSLYDAECAVRHFDAEADAFGQMSLKPLST
jgi:hypothetical protein